MATTNPDQKQEKIVNYIVRGIGALILIIVLLHFFFFPQNCDIDRAYLYCRVHPMQVQDILGLIIFIAAFYFLITGGRPFVKDDVYMAPHSSSWSFITLGAAAFGFFLMWV